MVALSGLRVADNVSRLSRSLGLVKEIFHSKTKLQRNRNSQPFEMPKFWLADVSGSSYSSLIISSIVSENLMANNLSVSTGIVASNVNPLFLSLE